MLEKVYNPKEVEKKWVDIWQNEKVFAPKIEHFKKPFVVVIPPPNITGALHMGHALNNTLQDVIIRYKRISGENTYWVVGTDHGGIATQNVLEKKLKSEGIRKSDMTREDFIKRMWEWYNECGLTILSQLKKIGCSIDFSKENVRFTMDEKRSKAVLFAFKELWDKKMIYRGERMINWCTNCYTALSDIEVEYEEEKTKLWYIKYPLKHSEDHLIIATTRPETMFGDCAVCVNPRDKRYKKLVGKTLILPLANREIKVIEDESVEMDFGTGALKITPAHDPLDYEIGLRHNLEGIKVISDNGRMINCPEKYIGMKVLKAREEVVKDLKESGFLVKEEDYIHHVGKCYRCENNIEPFVSEQWFVKAKEISVKTFDVISNDEVRFYPDKWKKPALRWLAELNDWCISRQIWWGHRIPAYYCVKCSDKGLVYNEKNEVVRVSVKNGAKPIVSLNKPPICPHCGGNDFVQDPDVLDTWFSSALWPFSVFGWPDETQELKYFYPTSTLVTGYEILYLWVLRMITSGLFHLQKIPFNKVYIHGIVRDKHGQKMSKSKGNVIDPIDMMKKYGTDAMRFSLVIGAVGGKDIHFSENSIIGGRNFINKIYNVSRFIQLNIEKDVSYEIDKSNLDLSDRWIITRINDIYEKYRQLMDNYELSEALDLVYGFVWDEFCDWYLEISKLYLNTERKKHKIAVINNVFNFSLKMLHPFIPFVTEEIYSSLKSVFNENSRFIIESQLKKFMSFSDIASKERFEVLMAIIKEIRTLRSEFSIHPAKEVEVCIISEDNSINVFDNSQYIKHLAKISVLHNKKFEDKSIKSVIKNFEIYLKVDENIDITKERTRIENELEELKNANKKWETVLSDKEFLTKAPESEVNKIKARIRENSIKIEKLKGFLASI